MRKLKPARAVLICLILLASLSACGQTANSEEGGVPATAPETSRPEPADAPDESGPSDGEVAGQADSALSTPASPDALQTILGAYTARDFVAGEISRDDLNQILAAGIAAPSARNSQPWHFVAVTAADLVDELGFQEGMALIVVCGETGAQEGVVVDFDCGLATQNMYLAAQALGLGSHIYTGPVRSLTGMADRLNVPDGYEPVALLAIGHESEGVDAVSAASARGALSDTVTYVE